MNHNKILKFLVVFLMAMGTRVAHSQQLKQRTMTIQELSESVLQNNIQLNLANTAIAVADARIGEVKTNRLPDLTADTKAFYLSDVSLYSTTFKKLQTVDLPNFGHQFNVNGSQLLFAGGKINKSIQLAELNKTLATNRLSDMGSGNESWRSAIIHQLIQPAKPKNYHRK